MTYRAALTLWQTIRSRVTKLAANLSEEELALQDGKSTIGGLLYHTAEVEFMFADWYFGQAIPEQYGVGSGGNGGGDGDGKPRYANKEELLQFMEASNQFLIEAMEKLPADAWTIAVPSKMGECTPLEAVGRLMYHAGLHAGMIYSRKNR